MGLGRWGGPLLSVPCPRCSPQVDYVEPSQNTISLKMIPRIDYDRIKARMSLVLGWHGLGPGVGDVASRLSLLPHPPGPCPLSSAERLVCQKEEVQAASAEVV